MVITPHSEQQPDTPSKDDEHAETPYKATPAPLGTKSNFVRETDETRTFFLKKIEENRGPTGTNIEGDLLD
jgi:hypothetical protein